MLSTLLVFAAIAAVQLPGLVRRKQWREFVLVVFFLGTGMALTIFLGLGGELPRFGL